MQETVKQYVSRLLSYSKDRDPLRILQGTIGKVERLLKKGGASRLSKRNSAGKCSVAEILAHLAEDEIAIGFRIRSILSENGVPIQGFDQEAWVKNSRYLVREPQRALDLWRILRWSNLALLKSIPRSMWNNYGNHSERGKETVSRVVRLVAGHDLNHLRQINQLTK